jgi:hypothetical protein
MSNTSGNLFTSILDLIASIFGKKKTTPEQPSTPPDSTDEPAQLTLSKVLVLVYDPVMDPASGKKLSELQGWNRVENLATSFMADILQVSNGLARYQIVQRIDIDEFPAKTDGFRYTPSTYLDVLRGMSSPHQPQEVDYLAILNRFNIMQRVSRSEIDEVWIFGFPHAGFYESTMAGAGAFWCNAPVVRNTNQCSRKFVVMGFSYERGVGEMLEAFGHRTESIVGKTFERLSGDANLWQRFTRYDKIMPGKAEVGTIHYAPNSERDYDWNNSRPVPSNCYDWYNFPNFRNDIRQVDASEWGRGDIHAHHVWWLKHLPKVSGRINGIHNNWWQYIIDPNRVQP